jgi:hypothetical protein
MPVVSLAQSPSGDIYFGGYSIDKLVSLNDDDKISTMESIYLQLPNSVKLDNLQLDTSQRKLDLSLSDSGGGNMTGTTMVVKIPTSLLTDIYKVVQVNKTPSAQTLSTDANTDNEIDFTVADSTPDYSTIEIPLQIQGNALISIIAG